MNKIEVTNYELMADKIVLHMSDGQYDCEYEIDRTEFEDWLTEGTGMVDMGFTHHNGNVLTEVEIKEPIADYWLQGTEINNSPVLQHLHLYVTRDELARCNVRLVLLEQHLKDILTEVDELKRGDAYVSLLEYGMLSREAGEHSASIVFRRIISNRVI